ncbi:histidinol-phosphatase HisJ [Paenibacillus polygoni]|uniref:Histidinol-phosphatase n=1 Tax=Paenibacillus polygoni TaxID=3050112 RepID=A0ABY8X1I3_9BACL|nr:histidinol-phosphatase HisJ [Paenibacillus polygoni]WIV19371.1 histidinol-phosphatase HisJ [Paenibacillus polygoni]
MLIDYHTHHARCGHAVGDLESYVTQAVKLGYNEIGLSDHMPLLHVNPAEYYPEMAMPIEELPRYIEECLYLRDKYKNDIEVRVGLEGDYIEGYEKEIEEIISAYPFDYVIGSVHFLKEWDITDHRQVHHWEGKDVLEVYELYYDAVQKAAKSGLYDFLGHIDAIKRFTYKPKQEEQEAWYALERETLEVIAECGIPIELNASGLSKPCAEMFPSERMLKQAYQLGIPVTVGSDAHDPLKVGENVDRARNILKEIGYTELATFKERKRFMVSL